MQVTKSFNTCELSACKQCTSNNRSRLIPARITVSGLSLYIPVYELRDILLLCLQGTAQREDLTDMLLLIADPLQLTGGGGDVSGCGKWKLGGKIMWKVEIDIIPPPHILFVA